MAAPDEDLARARRLIEVELRYGSAIEICERVLEAPDLSRKDRIEAYRLLGIAHASKGKSDSAETAFIALLELDPDFELDPLLSPKIRTIFEEAQKKTARPKIEDVIALPEDRRVTITARLEDPQGRVQDVLLFARFGDRQYEAQAMSRSGDRVEAILQLPILERLRVEYYLEARNAKGDALFNAGSAEAPSSLVLERQISTLPPAPPPIVSDTTPWYATWWVWVIAAGVVGAGVATAVVIDRTSSNGPEGTLDPIRLD